MGILRNRLEEYNKSDYCPMHMPGHKRNTKMLGTKLPYNIDITEIDGFDDLHHPTEIIKDIQERKTIKIFLLFPDQNFLIMIQLTGLNLMTPVGM